MSQSLPGQAAKRFSPTAFFASIAVCLLIILHIVVFSWLSLQRYDSFSTNALDLAYTDQVVWNILHGRFFYSTIQIDMSTPPFTYPSAAYHFQPILALLSLLYLFQSGPETLLVLQSIILGLGALPIFLLARDRLRSSLGGFVLALAYLLLPAMGWASLTGFHSLSLATTFLLFAFYFLQKRSYLGFSVFAFLLALASREDASPFIALMGLYALIVQKERKTGIWTIVASLGWFLLTTLLIIPYYTYSSGPFEVFRHYEFLDGTYQSALVFAVILIFAIYVLGFLTVQLPQRLVVSQRGTSYALLGLALLASGYYQYQAGASPLAKPYHGLESTPHQQLAKELIELIPSNAPLSTQSSLLSHLSQRQKVYLFPAIKDAQYIFLDVTNTPYPLEAEGVFQEATKLLNDGEFGVMVGHDGYILMKRGLEKSKTLPEEFYSFAKADTSEVVYPYSADFGQMFRLVGHDYKISYAPDTGSTITLTTYWQALKPPPMDYRLVLSLHKDNGDDANISIVDCPTTLWYPTRDWTVGQLMKIETPPLPITAFRYIDMGVVGANDRAENLLVPIESPEGRSLPIREGGHLQLLDLRRLPPSHQFSNAQLPPLSTTTTPTFPTPSPTPTPHTCPLCGQEVQEPGTVASPPLAVKIDNAPGARPQSGLSEACIVYEHLTEWGVTRFTAIYLCQLPDAIGPIRSARLIDLDLARQYEAVFAHVGASAPIMELLRISGLWDLDQFWYPDAYYRSNSRSAPHNVYSITPKMQETIQAKGWQEPETLRQGFTFDSEPPPGGTPVRRVEIPFSNYSPVEYRYDEEKGAYMRWISGQPHLDTDNDQIAASNVIVQWVKSWPTDIFEDAIGGRSLQFELTGEGAAEIFRDGQVFYARWVRHNPDDITKFFDYEGRLLPLKPGNTWIAIVPIEMEITKES